MKLLTRMLLAQFFIIFLYTGYLHSHAMDETLPRNAKEYYNKYLKGKGYRTSYNESVGSIPYEELGPFIQSEIKTEFKKWKNNKKRKWPHEEQEELITIPEQEEKSHEVLKKTKKSKVEKKSPKFTKVEELKITPIETVKEKKKIKEELSIAPEEVIQEENKEAPLVDEIANQLNRDKAYLKTIAALIMNREQTKSVIMEETKAKHGPESFEIWKKLPHGLSWGEKKKKLDSEDRQTLLKLFGSLDKAKMKINREDFIVAKKLILNNPVAKAKNVCKQGTIELIEDFEFNPKRPYTILCKIEESQVTGTLYKKNEDNEFSEEPMYKIYVAINISDIVDKIKGSKKKTWNSRREDWNKEQDGRMTTITPTQQ